MFSPKDIDVLEKKRNGEEFEEKFKKAVEEIDKSIEKNHESCRNKKYEMATYIPEYSKDLIKEIIESYIEVGWRKVKTRRHCDDYSGDYYRTYKFYK